MSNAFLTDLRFAQQAGRAVELRTYSGTHFKMVGVVDVDPEGQWISLHTPQTMQDDTTRTRVETSDIASVVVHNVEW